MWFLFFIGLSWAQQDVELKLRAQAEALSKINFERSKKLLGVDPRTCKEVSGPELEKILLDQRKQITSGEGLSHCESLTTPVISRYQQRFAENVPPRTTQRSISRPRPIRCSRLYQEPRVLVTFTPNAPIKPEPEYTAPVGIPVLETETAANAGWPRGPGSQQPGTPMQKPQPGSADSKQKKIAELAADKGLSGERSAYVGSYPYINQSEVPGAEYLKLAHYTESELVFKYLARKAVPTSRDWIYDIELAADEKFWVRTLTHFNQEEIAKEGMHALRLFYGTEPVETGAHNNPFECRAIISGDIEYTAATHATATSSPEWCRKICSKTLIAQMEKPHKGFLMSCHLGGQMIGSESRGEESEQGTIFKDKLKCQIKSGTFTQAWRGANVDPYNVSNEKTVREISVGTKSQCYRELINSYYDESKKIPLMENGSEHPSGLVMYFGEEGQIKEAGKFHFRQPIKPAAVKENKCDVQFYGLVSNWIHSESMNTQVFYNYLNYGADKFDRTRCEETCPAVFKKFGPGTEFFKIYNTSFADWSLSCHDQKGTFKSCTKLGGCK
jgi:hypothetical protein